ncbi:hypothetical protein AMECASPLE_020600 [Ameca splendens]|uniref:Uncharacterized protein n=1 Tax=Ameca splendens TaxID=208324 RepID=A0ABV0XSC4_9TELE
MVIFTLAAAHLNTEVYKRKAAALVCSTYLMTDRKFLYFIWVSILKKSEEVIISPLCLVLVEQFFVLFFSAFIVFKKELPAVVHFVPTTCRFVLALTTNGKSIYFP